MGVDYGASYGFGVEVTSNHEDFIETPWDFLNDILQGTSFSYFTVGNAYYNRRNYKFYITSDNAEMALDKGQYNLEGYAQELLDFLNSKPELEVLDTPNIVGGLLIS